MSEFRLREMRERAGMSVEELARLVNRSARYMARVDISPAAVNVMKLSLAANIAIALGCTLDELAGIEQGETK